MPDETAALFAAVRQRTLRPMRTVNFVKWTTTPGGYRIYAEDYGIRAFPIVDRRPRAARSVQPRRKPIHNGIVLQNGLRAGDHVRLQDVGTGRILLVTTDVTVVQLDGTGCLIERPTTMLWRQLRKVSENY